MMDYRHWFNLGSDFFELIIARCYADILKDGDSCLDIGANHGIHTVPMAKSVGLNGRVIAYEAVPDLVDIVRRATKHLPQVETLNVALSDTTGHAMFKWAKAADGYSGLLERDMPALAKASILEISVELNTVDRSLADLARGPLKNLRFIKMDIEGGEFHALKGARNTLKLMRPVVVLENGRQRMAKLYGYSKEEWFDLFDSLGYHVFDLFGRPFNLNRWDEQPLPWYSIAAPKDSSAEFYVQNNLPKAISEMASAPFVRLERPSIS